MNARQKAKHYKKLYEQTLYNVIRPEIKMCNNSRVKLKCRQTVDRDEFYRISPNDTSILTFIRHALCKDLAERIIDCAKITVEPSTIPNHVDVVASVEVIKWNE